MRDYLSLTKPRITLMVAATALAGCYLAGPAAEPFTAFGLALGTALAAAGASALNMVLEREADGRMQRTARRPIPAGRIAAREAALFGGLLSGAGLLVLYTTCSALSTSLCAATSLAYLAIYTPLKQRTSLCTVVGAAPGAAPILMGWAATGRPLGAEAWCLFAILFLWQLPHFLAIAWLYRADYEAGGYPMLSVLDRTGSSSGRQVVLQTVALVAVSLMPVRNGMAGAPYLYGAVALGLAFTACGVLFALTRTGASARRLFVASMVYLPVLLGLLALNRTG